MPFARDRSSLRRVYIGSGLNLAAAAFSTLATAAFLTTALMGGPWYWFVAAALSAGSAVTSWIAARRRPTR